MLPCELLMMASHQNPVSRAMVAHQSSTCFLECHVNVILFLMFAVVTLVFLNLSFDSPSRRD